MLLVVGYRFRGAIWLTPVGADWAGWLISAGDPTIGLLPHWGGVACCWVPDEEDEFRDKDCWGVLRPEDDSLTV